MIQTSRKTQKALSLTKMKVKHNENSSISSRRSIMTQYNA